MASVRKRAWTTASGERREAWLADFTDQHGKRHQHSFARRKDADAWLVTKRGEVAQGTFTADSTSATIGEACDLWLERAVAEGLEHGTRQQYRQHVVHILAVVDGDLKLSRLTTARCEQVRDDLLKAHSRDMARKVLQSFRSVVKDAKRRGLIAQNVAAETTIGGNGRHKARLKAGRDFPMPTEVKKLIEAGGPKARAMVCLAGLAGLRASELRALKWSDLALGDKAPTVTIEERADKWARVGSPKSESSRRAIPLGEVTVKALKEWRLAQPHGRALVFGTASNKPDLLGNLQKRLLSPLQVAADVAEPMVGADGKPVMEPVRGRGGKPVMVDGEPQMRAKMRGKYSWHALRHYAISSWLASGLDLKTVQHWAGHATLALTLDTYGHLIPRADDHARLAAAERMLLAT
jgi:integrase